VSSFLTAHQHNIGYAVPLRCHVDLSLGHLPDQGLRCRPGRPSNRWIDQVRRDNNNIPPADLCRRSIVRGHLGVTLRSLPTTR